MSETGVAARRLALGAGMALLIGAALAAQQRPVFRGGTNFVQVDVYPRRYGQVVAGLNVEDFEILEDGKPQKVELFEFIPFAMHTPDAARRDPNTVRESEQLAADPRYRVFVIYLDRYNTQLSASHEARRPVVQFLDRAIGPTDLFAVMTPDLPPTALAFGQRSETVEQELTKYWTWGTKESEMQAEGGTMNLTAPGEKRVWDCYITRYPRYEANLALVKQLLEVWRKDALFTSLEGLMIRMRGLREPRTNLLLLTEGWVVDRAKDQLRQHAWNEMPQVGVAPGGSTLRLGQRADGHTDHAECDTELFRLAQIDFDRRFRDLLTLARRSNVSVYPVDLAGLRAPVGVTATTNTMSVVSTLRTLAENTDGIAVVDTNSLERGLKEIADSLSSYYLLGYYSTNTSFDGKFRSIDVKVKRPGVSISARRGYFAPTEAMLKTGAAPAASAPATSAAPDVIAAALGRLKAASSTDLLTSGSASATEISVIAELSSRLAMASPWAAGADVTVTLTAGGDRIGVATGRIEPGARSVLVRVPTSASNGPWRAVVQVSSGRENVSDRLDIPPAASARLGDPAMYRATPAPASPLRPTADPSYRRTERAHIEWPVGAAGNTREARLLDRAGQKLDVPVTLTTREAAGRTVIAADVNLAPLSAGDYVIELIVDAGTSSERVFVAFRVTQ